ncbi:MAG: hypothetical protein DSY77_09535 [Bacteroidetes bacterium]|nr:MAG: hypothetical protein DSY77_09535 [Bacteroidota bacterium]
MSCSTSNICTSKKHILKEPIDLAIKNNVKLKGKYCFNRFESRNNLSDKAIVKGYVVSRNEGNPLKAVINIDKELKLGAISDVEGYYETIIEPGNYQIETISIGKPKLVTKKISIGENEILELNFFLGEEKVE